MKSGIITDVSTKKLLRRMHLGIAPSATHNYSKTFLSIPNVLLLLLLFFVSEFSFFLPFIHFLYIYCVLHLTAILINFSLIFVLVSLVFSEVCLCFTLICLLITSIF